MKIVDIFKISEVCADREVGVDFRDDGELVLYAHRDIYRFERHLSSMYLDEYDGCLEEIIKEFSEEAYKKFLEMRQNFKCCVTCRYGPMRGDGTCKEIPEVSTIDELCNSGKDCEEWKWLKRIPRKGVDI